MSPPQFRVLVILSTSRSPLRSGVLADALGVRPSTFTRTADRLVAGGWVRPTQNPDSRREILIELTGKGSRLVDEVTQRRGSEITRLLGRLDPTERGQVRTGLDTFARAAGEPAVGDLDALGI